MTGSSSAQPQQVAVAALMHQLKGAPLSILIVMGYFNRTMGRDELAMITSYSPATVGRGLQKLGFMGLAQKHTRFSGWLLTSKARQLPLLVGGNSEVPETIEAGGTVVDAATEPATPVLPASAAGVRGVKNLHLGSSSSDVSHSGFELSEKTNYQTAEVQKLHLEADGEAAVGLLLATGMPATSRKGNGARDVVGEAIDGGWSEAEVLDAVEGWMEYATSDRGVGVQHPGFFTGSKVRELLRPPARRELTRDAESMQFIADAYDRIVRH